MASRIKPGDRVRITNLDHDDGSCAHFIGQTGTIAGFLDTTAIVKGLNPNPDQGYGFFPNEIEPA